MVKRLLLIAMILNGFLRVAYAETTASFNRDTIRLNETVELTIESDQTSISRGVDFSELEKQFRINSQRRDTSASIINGQSQVVHRWRAELAPKSVGSFGVGPITVDREETNRLRLTVLPQAEEASVSEEVFIEVELDKNAVYVQEQILLTARLYVSVRLLDGALVDPSPADTLVRRLGKDVRYEAKKGDQSYTVFQRRYALIPQSSGDLVIPAIQFEGLADDIGAANNGVFNPLFSQGRRIFANGKALKVTVKPPAAGFKGRTWLPASNVRISERMPDVSDLKVGTPITRKILLEGTRVTAEQLPQIEMLPIDGVQIYPDQNQLQTSDGESGVIGAQSVNVAMIPIRAGEILLPEIIIPWWNTVTDQQEEATLPARRIVVNPATQPVDSANSTTPTVQEADGEEARAETLVAESSDPAQQANPVWKWLAIAFAFAWLVTTGAVFTLWQRVGKQQKQSRQPDEANMLLSHQIERIQTGCRQNNPAETRNALTAWSRQRFGMSMALPEIADRIGSRIPSANAEGLKTELQTLDQTLFSAADSANWNGSRLWRLFEAASAEYATGSAHEESALPELYPIS